MARRSSQQPELTLVAENPHDVDAREALREFVRSLARQQAWEDFHEKKGIALPKR